MVKARDIAEEEYKIKDLTTYLGMKDGVSSSIADQVTFYAINLTWNSFKGYEYNYPVQ